MSSSDASASSYSSESASSSAAPAQPTQRILTTTDLRGRIPRVRGQVAVVLDNSSRFSEDLQARQAAEAAARAERRAKAAAARQAAEAGDPAVELDRARHQMSLVVGASLRGKAKRRWQAARNVRLGLPEPKTPKTPFNIFKAVSAAARVRDDKQRERNRMLGIANAARERAQGHRKKDFERIKRAGYDAKGVRGIGSSFGREGADGTLRVSRRERDELRRPPRPSPLTGAKRKRSGGGGAGERGGKRPRF